MSSTRFVFPGFVPVRTADTSTHEVEIGEMKVGGKTLIIHLIRRIGLSFVASYLVSKVCDQNGKMLWNFQTLGFNGIGVLALAGDMPVIALLGQGTKGAVESVVKLSSIAANSNQLTILQKVELKRLVAQSLDRPINLSSSEETLLRHLAAQAMDAERVEHERKKAERNLKREETFAKLRMRSPVTAYTATGDKRYGVPVVDTEWQMLPHNTFVVLVESFDDANDQPGDAIEAFKVLKVRGKAPHKGYPSQVTWKNPQAVPIVRPIGTIVILTNAGDDANEVSIYSTTTEIEAARAAGLNGGALVAAKDEESDGMYPVYKVTVEKITPLGKFVPLAA